MKVAKVSDDYMLRIPDEFRPIIGAGQEVAVSADDQGRLVLTPIALIRARLLETFGMWAGRTDVPADGVQYMDDIRWGDRLDVIGQQLNDLD